MIRGASGILEDRTTTQEVTASGRNYLPSVRELLHSHIFTYVIHVSNRCHKDDGGSGASLLGGEAVGAGPV